MVNIRIIWTYFVVQSAALASPGVSETFASTLKKTADDLRSESRKIARTVAFCPNLGQM